jgi:hypothetical protein
MKEEESVNAFVHLYPGHPSAEMMKSSKNTYTLPTATSHQICNMIPVLTKPATPNKMATVTSLALEESSRSGGQPKTNAAKASKAGKAMDIKAAAAVKTAGPGSDDDSIGELMHADSFSPITVQSPRGKGKGAVSKNGKAAKGNAATGKKADSKTNVGKQARPTAGRFSPVGLANEDEIGPPSSRPNSANFRISTDLTLTNMRSFVPLDPVCPVYFACLNQFEHPDVKRLSTVLIRENEKALNECKAQYCLFTIMRYKNMRALGAMVLQIITHTVYTQDELSMLCRQTFTRQELAHKYMVVYKYPDCILDLLEICFSPVAPPIIEPQRGYNLPMIRMKCNITRELIPVIDALRVIVLKCNEDIEWVRPILWTEDDETIRQETLVKRLTEYQELATTGRSLAAARLKLEAKKLRFELLPVEVQNRIIKRRKAIQKSKENKAERMWFMKQAQYRHWGSRESMIWIADAVTASYRDAYVHAKKHGKFVRPTADVLNRKAQENAARIAKMMSGKLGGIGLGEDGGGGLGLSNLNLSGKSSFDVSMRLDSPTPTNASTSLRFASSKTSMAGASTKTVNYSVASSSIKTQASETTVGSGNTNGNILASQLPSITLPTTVANSKLTEKEEKKKLAQRNLQFLYQRLSTLLDPVQESIEKILLHGGYMFHGRKQLPTPYETDIDQDNLYRETGVRSARNICNRLSNRLLYWEIMNARKKADSRLNHSTLATQISEEALRTKKMLVAAEVISKNLPGLRQGILEFAKETDIHDRSWAKRQVLSVCLAIVEKFENTEWIRKKGEMLASAKINALYRQWKTRRLVSSVWIKAELTLKEQLAAEKEVWQKKVASGEIAIEIPDFDVDTQQQVVEDDELNALEPVEVIDCVSTESTIDITVAMNLGASRFSSNPHNRQYATCVGCVLVQPPFLPDVVHTELSMILNDHNRAVGICNVGIVGHVDERKSSVSLLSSQQFPTLAAKKTTLLDQSTVLGRGSGLPSISHAASIKVPIRSSALTAKDFDLSNPDGREDMAHDPTFPKQKIADLLGEGHGELVLILYEARQLTDVKEVFRRYLPVDASQTNSRAASAREGPSRPGSATSGRRPSGFGPGPGALLTAVNGSDNGTASKSSFVVQSPLPINSFVSLSPVNGSTSPVGLGAMKSSGAFSPFKQFADLPALLPVQVTFLGPKQDDEAVTRANLKARMNAIQSGLPMPEPILSNIDLLSLRLTEGLRPYANYRVRVLMSDIYTPRIESQRNNFDIYALVKVSIEYSCLQLFFIVA